VLEEQALNPKQPVETEAKENLGILCLRQSLNLAATFCLQHSSDDFLDERRYLKNVRPATIEWYETAFKAFQKTLRSDAPQVTKTSLQSFVVKLRQRNMKPVSVNTYIKALNAFCRWLHEEGHHAERLAKLRRSPLTAYWRAGNVTLRPLPPRRSQMLKPISLKPSSAPSVTRAPERRRCLEEPRRLYRIQGPFWSNRCERRQVDSRAGLSVRCAHLTAVRRIALSTRWM
jgi:integrase